MGLMFLSYSSTLAGGSSMGGCTVVVVNVEQGTYTGNTIRGIDSGCPGCWSTILMVL